MQWWPCILNVPLKRVYILSQEKFERMKCGPSYMDQKENGRTDLDVAWPRLGTKKALNARIVIFLAGAAAEKVMFGDCGKRRCWRYGRTTRHA